MSGEAMSQEANQPSDAEGKKTAEYRQKIREYYEKNGLMQPQRIVGELQASQRSYEDLVNTIDGLVWEQSLPGRQLTFVSRKAEAMLGYPVERWLREPGFWLAHVHPDDRTSAASYWDAVVARKGSGESQYRMLAADGRTIWVRDHYSVLVDQDEAVTIRGVLVDISSMKRTEEFTRLMAVVAEAANRATHDVALTTIDAAKSISRGA